MLYSFSKLSACGNDFVAMDNRQQIPLLEDPQTVRRICDRRMGIGADGLLLVENDPAADFRMRIFNPDGSEARMCGNGARACAHFASSLGIGGKRLRFTTRAGMQEAEATGEGSRLWLSAPEARDTGLDRLRGDSALDSMGAEGLSLAGFIRVGVPHLVVEAVKPASDAVLKNWGARLAHHAAWGEEGTNVMFAHLVAQDEIHLRSWEKGVEDETWGCGTGAVASRLLLGDTHDLTPTVIVKMKGGELTVMTEGALSFSGSIHEAFRGEIELG
jgi:diaminopimelate epimerase